MKTLWSVVAAFIAGVILGGVGIWLVNRHVSLSLPDHMAWYEYLVYAVYPGSELAFYLIDPTQSAVPRSMVIMVSNGLVYGFVALCFSLIFWGVKVVWRKFRA